MTHVDEDAVMRHTALCSNLKINKSFFKKMKWSHRSETHLDKLQTSDFLITDRTTWEMNTQPWARLSRFQLTFWGKPDSSVISTLDLFWKHTRVFRQKPQHPVFPAAGVTILRTTTAELERPTGNVSEQVCPLRGAKGHPSEISRFRRSALMQGVGGKS